VQLADLKYYFNPKSFMFGQALKFSIVTFFRYLEACIASRVVLVIRVALKSNTLKRDAFELLNKR